MSSIFILGEKPAPNIRQVQPSTIIFGRPADGRETQLPVTPRAIALVKQLLLERQFQMRRAKP
jgi:hypothetical protein